MRNCVVIFAIIGVANSLVDFENSALYDIYDFRGAKEVAIPKCDSGCLIFAATMGEGFIQYPDRLDPYANNLFIYVDEDVKSSIAKIATQRDEKLRKIPLKIETQSKITVRNQNEDNDKDVIQSIVLYVVKYNEAAQFSYEVFDTYYSKGSKITPQSEIVTILSAGFFGIQADATTQANSVTVRLVGFENALDNNAGGCPYAYNTPDSPSFGGFSLQTTTPILSLVVGKSSSIQLQTETQFNSVRKIGYDGFITSPGWNGCSKPKNGGFQSFRTPDDSPSDTYMLTNNDNMFNVDMDVLPNFDATHSLTITNMKSVDEPTTVTGTTPQQLHFKKTNFIVFDFDNMKGDQGFLLRYSTTLIPSTTTSGPTTSTSTPTTVTTSADQSLATTSSASAITGILSPMLLYWLC